METSLETVEMIKYASNAFLAVKITFINEIANLGEKIGANVQEVANATGKDRRIGSKFLHAGPCYEGSCFPKDTRALARMGRDHEKCLRIVESTIAANEPQKERMVRKIQQGMGGVDGKTIAVLGLSFKPMTADMRDAPSPTVCNHLVKRGGCSGCGTPAAMQERLHEEVRRGSRVLGTFPGGEAYVRLSTAYLIEYPEECMSEDTNRILQS